MPFKNPTKRRAYHNAYNRKYYRENAEYRQYIFSMQRDYRKRNRVFVARVKRRFGCKNCSMKNPVCLDFHHLRDKKRAVSEMVGMTYSIEQLKTEIRKCYILCANCHRIEEARKRRR